jgi:hypothetical protein
MAPDKWYEDCLHSIFMYSVDMATKVKPCLNGYEQQSCIHDSVTDILRQPVTKVNSCYIIWLFQLMPKLFYMGKI